MATSLLLNLLNQQTTKGSLKNLQLTVRINPEGPLYSILVYDGLEKIAYIRREPPCERNCVEHPIVGIVQTFYAVWEVRVGSVSPIHKGAVMVQRFGSGSVKPEINCPLLNTKSFSVH